LEFQASGFPDQAAMDKIPPSSSESTVTDLLARSGPRHGRRTSSRESF
jgi:hypothetical protein